MPSYQPPIPAVPPTLPPKPEEADKFISKAIKKPGALRKSLGTKAGNPIGKSKLQAAAKKPGKLGQRARFALTLSKLRKGK